jgi:RNA polymerase sigma-70 factor (ECF subfamily)
MRTQRMTGDDRAFTQAYEDHAPGLRRYAAARTRDVTLAEDIVQEAFVRLATEERAGRVPTNRGAWLYRVTQNLVISGSRRATVARRWSSALSMDDVATDSPESIVLAHEQDRALLASLGATSPIARMSLVLAAEGYSGREIAMAIGRSESATRALMCRARSSVRRDLARRYADVA